MIGFSTIPLPGAAETFGAALQCHARFDPTRCFMACGDLVYRGLDSVYCVGLVVPTRMNQAGVCVRLEFSIQKKEECQR
ncbi:hypothetical protein XAC3607_4280009 [Xanthomonas citri pv. citri]|nr:hypothetical protein XAC3615_14180004 [Xanthomonas citri pv. citri]CEH94208.1 hypothetical protein XAC3607_4280009 [Xanthomonas citri pv. citri]